jgi:taurine transport system permease protein
VARAFVLACTNGYAGATLPLHILASLLRLAVAFGVTVAIGVPLGLAMGTHRWLRDIVNPWFQLYRPVPSLAYMGLLVIWLGVDDVSRITLLILGGLPAVVIGTAQAVGAVRPDRVQGARSLGIDGFALFRTVIFPSCLPDIFTAVRIASTGVFTTLIAAEMMGARTGLGAMLMAASYAMEPGIVILCVIVMGVMGLAVDQVLRGAQHRLVPWTGKF